MEDTPLYQQIVDAIRKEIYSGALKPGDRLPPVRQMTARWECTPGTILHAYQELARQGLIVSHVGRGTKVAEKFSQEDQNPLRRAVLLNRIEANLLEIMTSGYTPDEVEQAMRISLDRWRAVTTQPPQAPADVLRFSGSHDPAVSLIASIYNDLSPAFTMQLSFTGSLGGLIALATKDADLAGCHLWDAETNTYNVPFIRRLLPGQPVYLLTLAHRRVGLILPPGNPLQITSLPDLARPGLRFVNRQQGSGTRVWLDAQLQTAGVNPSTISGYPDEKMTHSEVARAISTGQAEAGLGVETAALAFGLDFILLTTERYDLAVPAEKWELKPMLALRQWLESSQAKAAIHNLGGYDTLETGSVICVS